MNSQRTYLLFALNILVWGYNWVPLHLLVEHVGPATLSAARVGGGALALLAALLVMRRSVAMPRSPAFVAVGLLQVSAMIGLSTFALLFGDVSRTAILIFTMPFWATIFSRFILHEHIGKRKWAALCIAVLGLLFIASHSSGNPHAILGAILAVSAGASWAAGSVLAKRYLTNEDMLSSVMWQQVVGTVPLLAFALIRREPFHDPSASTIALFVFASVIGSGLGWLLWANVLKRVSASTASLGSLGIPLIAAIAAFLQLGERPDSVSLIGLCAILLAIAVSSWPAPARAQPASESSRDGTRARPMPRKVARPE